MNKLVKRILIAVGVVLLSVASSLGYHKYYDDSNVITKDVDSEQIAQMCDEWYNPNFTNVTEALAFREEMARSQLEDSIFLNIPAHHLRNIANVVINRKGSAKVEDIVQEYIARYQEVYQYIGKPDDIPEPAKPDKISPPVDTIRLAKTVEVDTIINGKHFTFIKEVTANE